MRSLNAAEVTCNEDPRGDGDSSLSGTVHPIHPALTALERVMKTWRAEAIETDPDTDSKWGLHAEVFCLHL